MLSRNGVNIRSCTESREKSNSPGPRPGWGLLWHLQEVTGEGRLRSFRVVCPGDVFHSQHPAAQPSAGTVCRASAGEGIKPLPMAELEPIQPRGGELLLGSQAGRRAEQPQHFTRLLLLCGAVPWGLSSPSIKALQGRRRMLLCLRSPCIYPSKIPPRKHQSCCRAVSAQPTPAAAEWGSGLVAFWRGSAPHVLAGGRMSTAGDKAGPGQGSCFTPSWSVLPNSQSFLSWDLCQAP